MKYWALFLAKLVAIAGVATSVEWLINRFAPISEATTRFGHQPFAHDLTYTFIMMLYTLFCVGLIYLAILDQRFRCRTCVTRLRMPVNSGSWDKAMLFAPPRTEYICPFGHGTLGQRDLQISGHEYPEWQEHKDMWEELESLGRK